MVVQLSGNKCPACSGRGSVRERGRHLKTCGACGGAGSFSQIEGRISKLPSVRKPKKDGKIWRQRPCTRDGCQNQVFYKETWDTIPDYCKSCHQNRVFIRTVNEYKQVVGLRRNEQLLFYFGHYADRIMPLEEFEGLLMLLDGKKPFWTQLIGINPSPIFILGEHPISQWFVTNFHYTQELLDVTNLLGFWRRRALATIES